LLKQARTLGVPHRFHGLVSASELVEALEGGDAVLLCTSSFEGYSVAVAEAAARGVPVVGLAAPGVERAIEACGGVLVDSPRDLHVAIAGAWSAGNRVSAMEVQRLHDESVVGAAFWKELIDSAALGRAR
jgi:glycosyltransferase involved in cell wall biosynthesis